MRRLLLLPLLLSACGLDDFSWGGPKDPCEVAWRMRFQGFEELDLIRPTVSAVDEDEHRVTWIASYRFEGEMVRARFTITGPRLDVHPLEGYDGPGEVISSHCEYDEKQSALRSEPLARYVCAVRLESEEPPFDAEAERFLVFEEFDHCPPG